MSRNKIAKRWPEYVELRETIKAGVQCLFLGIYSGYIQPLVPRRGS